MLIVEPSRKLRITSKIKSDTIFCSEKKLTKYAEGDIDMLS